jgi:hypothetical protein
MTDERKTDPSELRSSAPPGHLTAEDMAWETLQAVRSVKSVQQLDNEELRLLRLRFDELVLLVIPRIEQLEAVVKELRPRVDIAEELCDRCPLKQAAGT